MKAPKYRTSCVERFLHYVTIDTQSKEDAEGYPSTPGQLAMLKLLVEELNDLGLEDAAMDQHGYVFATIPATTRKKNVPVIGFIAHVDTSPEMSGSDVRPIVHRDYQGEDIVLPDDPQARIRLADNPALSEQIGNDIITASGKTLLGADNKAGVAEIVGAAEFLMAHPEVPHGPIRLGFTPDEEIGAGTKFFDVQKFGACYAYTMDGGMLGEIQDETFSADSLTVTFVGFNTHPGFARGKMINAVKIAADFIHRLPGDLAPESTHGKQGYVHPYVVDAGVERTSVKLLIRDFSTPGLKKKADLLRDLARKTVKDHAGAEVEFSLEESYRNMKEVLDAHPHVVDYAKQAVRRAGVEVRLTPIRGGTDGSRLCFMGLPTPNIFAGEHNFHSRQEWISTYDMNKAVEVIIELCKLWEEQPPG